MSRYNNQYGNYYDPVGSHSSQPSGYSYQTSTAGSTYPNTATSSGFGSNYQNYGANTYGNQQYAPSANQQANTSSSATHAAAALSSLSNQEYSQGSSANRNSSNNQYDNSSWLNQGSNSNVYGANSSLALPNRTQSNNSPLSSNAPTAGSFGRITVPEQTQSSSNTFGGSHTYQNAPSTAAATTNRSYQAQQQSQPPRYNSPLHAAQAQQRSHNKQASRGSDHLPSPQMAQAVRSAQQNRFQSASVEPSPTTVDPSQVYDNRAELQRKAQIEAEKRRKYEAEQAAKPAEEERIAAEEKRKEEEEKAKAEEEAKKKAEQQRKNEQRKKAREEKKQSKSAASALTQLATSAAQGSSATEDDEEAQMRAMFQKMRDFNAKNPALLAKLWDEERRTHESAKASPASASKAAAHAKALNAISDAGGAVPARSTPSKPTSPSVTKAASKPAATQQPLRPPTGQANTSLWPPHKKGAIAEATAKWLLSLPQNVGTSIESHHVLNILNANPSYVQLCEALEGLGLKFERSTLARELLKAVPDGLRPQAGPKTATLGGDPLGGVQMNGRLQYPPVSPLSKGKGKEKDVVEPIVNRLNAAGPGTVGYEAPLSLSEAARQVNNMDDNAYQPMYGSPERAQQSPYFSQSQTLPNGSRPPSQSQPPEVKQEDRKPEEPPRLPADKEEAARKRTFADLVDLTAEDSEDDAPPPKKVMQPPSAPINGASTQPGSLHQPIPFNQFMYRQPPQGTPTQSYQPRPPTVPSSAPSYVPTQNALPQPPPIPSKPKGPSPEQLQQARMKGKMLVEPIMRDRVARKSRYDSRTIARDVLLATGRHPDMRGLNAHLVNMHKILASHGGETDSGGNRSDLSTIRWDVIDPVPSREEKGVKHDAPSQQGTGSSGTGPAGRVRELPNTVNYETPAQDRSAGPPQKKRGRPPKYSIPSADGYVSSPMTNGLGTNAKTPRPAITSTSRPTTPSSSPAAANMSGGVVGYSAFAQTAPDGTKKKGRPFGWRKNVHSREAQGLPKAVTGDKALASRPKGRPPGSAVAGQQVQEPQYQVYKCEWMGCKSELHNLETLRKHVVKMHGMQKKKEEGGDEGDGEGVFECWWNGCKLRLKQQGKPGRFGEIEGWIQHVDKEHLQPVAWKLGDGPRDGVVSETSIYFHSPETPPSYLSDSHGRSVTPIISPRAPAPQPSTDGAADSQPAREATPAIRRPGRPPKDGIPKTLPQNKKIERDTELKKLEEHQRIVGPTLERMGCVLASEERRGTFFDGEDFEGDGWGSEHDPGDALMRG